MTTENPKPADGDKVIDWQRAFETVGGDQPLLKELVAVFLKEQTAMEHEICKAASADDNLNLRISAHSLKGAASHLGATHVSRIAKELELIGEQKRAEVSITQPLVDALKTAMVDVSREFKKFAS